VDTAARMLGACGWSLVAMPSADVPPGALVIDDTRPADARTPGAAPARQATPARAARHAAPRRAPSADVDALAGALAALPPSARAALARALAPADAPDADAADDAR
jgi:hypothetical protein